MISLHEFTCTYFILYRNASAIVYVQENTDYYRDVKDMVFTFRITKNGIKPKTA